MAIEPIAYIGLHLGPDPGANDAVVGVRIVPTGRAGNVVYARTLNADEPDTGERITLEVGEQLVLPPGSAKVTIADVDRYAEPEPDGYAAMTNTVWTWLQIPPHPGEEFFHYMLAISRRLDQAHARWVGSLRQLDNRPGESFIKSRARIFDALGNAESMCNVLNRAVSMMKDAPSKLGVKTSVPNELKNLHEPLEAIRNAFEHIDERATGRAHREGPVDALSIFNQGDLVAKGVLQYADYSLSLRTAILPALIAGRKFVYDVIAELGNTKTIDLEIAFEPVMEYSGEVNMSLTNEPRGWPRNSSTGPGGGLSTGPGGGTLDRPRWGDVHGP